MADYECFPLWESGDDVGNVDPKTLALPNELVAELLSWADEYTATLVGDDPPTSGFVDEATAQAWLTRGAFLAGWLRDEGFQVWYFHEGREPSELVAPAR